MKDINSVRESTADVKCEVLLYTCIISCAILNKALTCHDIYSVSRDGS